MVLVEATQAFAWAVAVPAIPAFLGLLGRTAGKISKYDGTSRELVAKVDGLDRRMDRMEGKVEQVMEWLRPRTPVQ